MNPSQLTSRGEVGAWLTTREATLDVVGPVESVIIRNAYASDALDRLERGTLPRIVATTGGKCYAIRYHANRYKVTAS